MTLDATPAATPPAPAPLRLGLIGCGANMAGHAGRLLANPEVEIVGLADPYPESVARIRERRPPLAAVPAFASHGAMLRELRPDAAVISTPHTLHFEHIMDSLESGCHVLVEKPMVSTVAHARQVVRYAEESGRVVLVSYQRHYQPAFRFIKQTVESGQIGQLQFVHALQNQKWYRSQKAANRWRIHPELSGGGQLNDSGSHILDILLYASGLAVESVYCQQESFDLQVDVNSSIALRFVGGALGSISIVGNAPGIGGAVWEDITFYGSEGAIYYRMMGCLATAGDRAPVIELRLQSKETPEEAVELPAGTDPDANFVEAVRGRAPVESPALCGLRVAELTEAAWRSAELGQPVRVADLG